MLLSETKNQLKILQEEKQNIIASIKTKYEYDKKLLEFDNEIEKLNSLNLDVNELSNLEIKVQKEERELFSKIKDETLNNKRIIEIEKEMAKLNKLDDSEKNIHAIWIGIPPKGEFDYIKAWAKFNPEYKIHIWIDSNHVLSHKLGSIIFEHVKNINDEEKEYDYEFEAWLKDEFYHDYHLKNLERTFDENVKDFLNDEMYASEEEINSWLKEGKEKLLKNKEKLKNIQIIKLFYMILLKKKIIFFHQQNIMKDI